MSLGIVIELLSVSLAIAGILLQTRQDPSKMPSWKNLSNGGRLILSLIVTIAIVKVFKIQSDGRAQEKALKESKDLIFELKTSNDRLIKVMSVSTGYNAVLSGYVLFQTVPTQSQVENVLRNLFLKYADVEINATNMLGKHQGSLSLGSHPEIRRYLSFNKIHENPSLLTLKNLVNEQEYPQAFYYEIRCPNLKILNKNNIQYVNLDSTDQLQISARVFETWSDFSSLYDIKNLYIDKLLIEELEEKLIGQKF